MKLCDAMNQAGMSTEILAALIDVSVDTMQEYLAGIRKIHPFKKKKICRILRTENIVFPVMHDGAPRHQYQSLDKRISAALNKEMYQALMTRTHKEKISLSEGIRKAIKKYTRS